MHWNLLFFFSFNIRQNMTNNTSLESSYALLWESSKKCKTKILFAKPSYKVKMFAKNRCLENDKTIHFEKAKTMPFRIGKNCCKILNNLM